MCRISVLKGKLSTFHLLLIFCYQNILTVLSIWQKSNFFFYFFLCTFNEGESLSVCLPAWLLVLVSFICYLLCRHLIQKNVLLTNEFLYKIESFVFLLAFYLNYYYTQQLHLLLLIPGYYL